MDQGVHKRITHENKKKKNKMKEVKVGVQLWYKTKKQENN